MLNCDKLIIGAGFYGLYSALRCGERGQNVVVLERDPGAFMRASFINQARVHLGYHYPRSISTAMKSAKYFERFISEFEFCIYKTFDQVYATSSKHSWTNSDEFKEFCKSLNIRCESIDPNKFFKTGMCDGAFLTTEYTYDAQLLKKYLLNKIKSLNNVSILYNTKPKTIEQDGNLWIVRTENQRYKTPYILNATYAGVNDILGIVHGEMNPELYKIKYEKCEIIICTVDEKIINTGITVMDGPFFSLMPFGFTGYHSLTSVTFTPHETSYDSLASFECQRKNGCKCNPGDLDNCNTCAYKPVSSWVYMRQLAKKYLKDEYSFEYKDSLYSMKPILLSSEIDDSRPTVIKCLCENPIFVSVLSGKINTVYDLDEVLDYE